MFEYEKFLFKKCFANNNNDSRINEKLCSIVNEQLLMVRKGLDLTFTVV